MFRILFLGDKDVAQPSIYSDLLQLTAGGQKKTVSVEHATQVVEAYRAIEQGLFDNRPVGCVVVDLPMADREHTLDLVKFLANCDNRLQILVFASKMRNTNFVVTDLNVGQVLLLEQRLSGADLAGVVTLMEIRWQQMVEDAENRRSLNQLLAARLQKLDGKEDHARDHAALEQAFWTAFLKNPVPQAMVVVDGLIWHCCNEAFCRLTGWPTTPPPWAEAILDEEVGKQLADPGAQVSRHPMLLNVANQEEPVPVLLSSVPFLREGVAMQLLTVEDMRASLQKSQEEKPLPLPAENNIKGLRNGMDHNLNNHMTVAYAQLSTLLEDTDLPDYLREPLELVKSAQERVLQTVTRWLPSSAAKTLRLRWRPTAEVVNSFLGMVSAIMGERISVETDELSGLPPVQVDDAILAQIFLNLSNSAKDVLPGPGSIKLTAGLHRRKQADQQETFVRLVFADDAHGQAGLRRKEHYLAGLRGGACEDRAAQRWQQAQQMSFRLGGWMECDFGKGDLLGTKVSIFLPMGQPEVNTASSDTSAARKSRGQGRCILVVEDEIPIRTLLSDMLTQFGYKTLTAGDADEALKIWEASPAGQIDAVITDIAMPGGLTGLQLASTLRMLRPDLRIVFTSGYTVEQLSRYQTFRQIGNFLPKPYTMQDVGSMLTELFAVPVSPAASAEEADPLSTTPAAPVDGTDSENIPAWRAKPHGTHMVPLHG